MWHRTPSATNYLLCRRAGVSLRQLVSAGFTPFSAVFHSLVFRSGDMPPPLENNISLNVFICIIRSFLSRGVSLIEIVPASFCCRTELNRTYNGGAISVRFCCVVCAVVSTVLWLGFWFGFCAIFSVEIQLFCLTNTLIFTDRFNEKCGLKFFAFSHWNLFLNILLCIYRNDLMIKSNGVTI